MSANDTVGATDVPADPPIGVTTQPVEPATHRCRRCLLWFEYLPGEPIAGPTEWWLCPPCQLKLIGHKS